jgi:hypothetical protein
MASYQEVASTGTGPAVYPDDLADYLPLPLPVEGLECFNVVYL